MKIFRLFLYIILLGIFSIGCEYEPPIVIPDDITSGTADFTRIVSIGSSITAGYMDGALYSEGQSGSFPSILANQFLLAGDGEFQQPDINSVNGYNILDSDSNNIRGKLILKFLSQDATIPSIVYSAGELPMNYSGEITELNNFGIPGLKSFQIAEPQLLNNIYYERFASDYGQTSLLEEILSVQPSFFSLWIGISDVLNYALSGGTGNPEPVSIPSQIEKNDLTPLSIYEGSLNRILDSLFNNQNIKGAIANIPLITDFSYFTTIPTHNISITDPEYDVLYYYFLEFNDAVSKHNLTASESNKRPFIKFIGGYELSPPQPLLIEDNSLADALYPDGSILPKIRLIEADEKVLSSAPKDQFAHLGLGSIIPVSDKYIITRSEMENITNKIAGYNNSINAAVQNNSDRLVLVDIYSFFLEWALTKKYNSLGIPLSDLNVSENGVSLSFDYEINNGYFSVDGLFPNQKGSAFLTNMFIELINEKFNSNIPKVLINHYKGNTFETAY